jgi:hypothetical protein
MRKTIKSLSCIIVCVFLLTPTAFAESEYADGWIGTWTVIMDDESTVTWEITDTWVSDTGKSHIAYGIKNPGEVEFQIYYSTFFTKYQYIEADHDLTVYDLPQDLSQYTELVPDRNFQSFTTKPGPYPIDSGYKGTEPPEPDETCPASELLGADDPRLDIVRQFRDEKMVTSKAGRKLIKLYYEQSDDLIDLCEKNPAVKWSLKLMLESIIPVLYIILM